MSSKGGNFNANGRGTASNLWTVDGAANQDTDGGGTGPQARITLDSMAEFQVLTHQYTAEFGGSSGVIVNAVTKSGTNDFAGRAFYYFEDDKLRATDPFVKAAGEPNPEAGRDTFGFNVGGPIVRNRRSSSSTSSATCSRTRSSTRCRRKRRRSPPRTPTRRVIKALSTFARVDYTAGRATTSASAGSARCRRRWARTSSAARRSRTGRSSSTPTTACSTSAGRRLFGNRATNEARFSHVGEDRVDGNLAYMNVDPSQLQDVGLD